MSYLVLARKWRPRTFAEMIGQEHVTRTLTNALASRRTAHAYLFHGPRGIGKTTAARILAKAVNCEKGFGSEPCNSCSSCEAINQGSSLDVVEMDGASNRGIDEIRELKEHVGYAPVSSRQKVYIIDEVHMLTEQAFNALLKTLEEPPPHVLFIFATTEVHKVPATILSRCQRFEFRRIPHGDVIKRLRFLADKEGIEITDSALSLMSRRAGGCLRDAESLLDQVTAASNERITEEMVRGLLGLIPLESLVGLLESIGAGSIGDVARQVDHMVSESMEPERIVADLMDLILRLIRSQGGEEALFTDEESRRIALVVSELQTVDLLRILNILQNSEYLARQSTMPQPVLESALFRCAMMDRSVSIERFLSEVTRHEAQPPAPPSKTDTVAETRPPAPPARNPEPHDSHHDDGGSSPQGPQNDSLKAALKFVGGSVRSFVNCAQARWDDETTLILAFGNDEQFAYDSLKRNESRGELERALTKASGRNICVKIEQIAGGPAPVEQKRPEDDPMVRRIVEQFDGVVVETRHNTEERSKQ